MIKSRLLILADKLDAVAKKLAANKRQRQFNLKSWFTRKSKHICNTSACAVGEACFIPAFNKLGLKLTDGYPVFGRHTAWSAVEKFFGLEGEDARYLFDMYSYSECTRTTADTVAARIRQFVTDGGQ